ncbi:hypothetical protein [Pontibacter cellulosilyticus]|uniref:Uncharacterized protein n=1 Tax=Pontibacter cellulosilyticus TaxID=1720253 RepID=A0A923N5K7_9BACT|nr:hypothetical protein [Pontibacter cellulosilyticus]MBC5992569.1 hypothetical protein [Pontibacter cellulosilyticus]
MPDIFVFKLTDKEGQNLLDKGLVNLDQITLQAANTSFSAELYTLSRGNETWIEAIVHRNLSDYELWVNGFGPQQLNLKFTEKKGDCCTTASVQEVYQNGTLAIKTPDGNVIILQ